MPSGHSLTEDVEYGILPWRLRPLNQCLAKTNFLDFFGPNSVTRDVFNSICQPDEFVNLHSAILD
jgi:hypothetical protein